MGAEVVFSNVVLHFSRKGLILVCSLGSGWGWRTEPWRFTARSTSRESRPAAGTHAGRMPSPQLTSPRICAFSPRTLLNPSEISRATREPFFFFFFTAFLKPTIHTFILFGTIPPLLIIRLIIGRHKNRIKKP